MNDLKTLTKAALDRLPLFEDSSHTIECESGGNRLRGELVQLDKLACAFNSVGVECDKLASASMDRLKLVAEQLSKKLTYLLEPISPVEVDSQQCVVQLRSTPPSKDDGATTYYELLVRRGGLLSLCRFAKQSGSERKIVPAAVTREVFLRLADDLGNVV